MAKLLEESDKDLDRIQDTVWGTKLTAAMALGLPVTPERGTTLNEKFTINEGATIKQNDKYITGFYCIGNGGHRSVQGVQDISINEPVDHDPLHGALYNHLPFALRRLDNDFTEEERREYRLRRKENHGGVDYWAYYAKVFTTEKIARVILETTNKGKVSESEYTPNEHVLSPVKPVISPRRVQRTTNTKVSVDIGSQIVFTENDVRELYNVCRIIYNNVAYAKISEIGLIMGVDDTAYVSPLDNTRHTELKGAVISTFISTMHDVVYNSDGFIERIAFGGKKPLLSIGNTVPTVGS